MPGAQGKGRSGELAVRPVRPIGPYDPIPLAVCAHPIWWLCDEEPTVDNFSITDREREIFEFEGGEGAF